MKTYEGVRGRLSVIVTVTDGLARHPLPLRLELHNHSPTGFNWGYPGSGPAQLALAICADVLGGDHERALRVYQIFKNRMIVPLAGDAI